MKSNSKELNKAYEELEKTQLASLNIMEDLEREREKLQADIIKRRKVEKSLRESEEKFRNLAEQSPNMIFINKKGRVAYANKRCEEIMGYKREKFYSPDFDFLTLIAPESIKIVKKNFRRHMKGEEIPPYEHTIITKEGKKIEVINTSRLINYEGESAILGILTDITKLKKAEEEIKESERRFRDLAESLPQLVWTCLPDGPCDYLSLQWREYTGIPEAEQLGFGWLKQLHPEDRERTVAAWNDAVKKDTDFNVEFRIRRADGVYRWFKTRAVAMRDADGKIIKWFGSNTDIDDLKKADEEIKIFSNAVESAYDSLLLTGMDGNITYANKSAMKVFGYTPGEIMKLNVSQLTTNPVDAEKVIKEVKTKGIWNGELTCIRKNKEEFPVILTTSSVKDEKDNPTAMMGIFRDITERKKADEALRKSESKYSSLVEKGNDGIIILQDNLLKFANSKMSEINGFSIKELVGKPFIDFVYPECRELFTSKYKKRIAGEEFPNMYEIEILSKDGRKIPVEVNGSMIEYNGRPADMAIIRDVTERKCAEDALRESEEKFRLLVESATEGIVLFDIHGNIMDINPKALELLGLRHEEVLGKNFIKLLSCFKIDVKKIKEITSMFKDVLIGKTLQTSELTFTNKKGMQITVIPRPTLIRKDERIIGVSIIIENITDLKQAERKIQQRLDIERVISAISSRLVNIQDFDCAINESLAGMGVLSDADRVYVFLLNKDKSLMDNTHEWCAEGVSPQIDNLKNLPCEMVPWWMKKLYKDEVIHITDVSKLPQEAKAEKEKLESQGIKSLLVLPLTIKGDLVGFMGFDNTRTTGQWSDENLMILRTSSQIIGYAFERRKAEEKLKEYHHHLEGVIEERTSELKAANKQLQYEIIEHKKTEEALQETEKHFRTAVDFTYDWEYWIGSDGNTIYISPSCERITGYRSDEFLKDSGLIEKITHPDDLAIITGHIQEELVHREVFSIDFRIISRSGEERWISHVCQPVYGTDGSWLGIRASNRDITDRKQAEDALKNSEITLKSILSSLTDFVFGFDKEGRFTFYHAPSTSKLYAPPEKFIGKTPYEIMPPHIHKPFADAFEKNKNGEVAEYEYYLEICGETMWFSAKQSPIVLDGEFTGSVAVMRDITKRRKAEEALNNQKEKI